MGFPLEKTDCCLRFPPKFELGEIDGFEDRLDLLSSDHEQWLDLGSRASRHRCHRCGQLWEVRSRDADVEEADVVRLGTKEAQSYRVVLSSVAHKKTEPETYTVEWDDSKFLIRNAAGAISVEHDLDKLYLQLDLIDLMDDELIVKNIYGKQLKFKEDK